MKKSVNTEIDKTESSTETKGIVGNTLNRMSNNEIENSSIISVMFEGLAVR